MLLLPFAHLTQSVSFAVFLALGQDLHVYIRLLLLLLLTTQIALLLLELALLEYGKITNELRDEGNVAYAGKVEAPSPAISVRQRTFIPVAGREVSAAWTSLPNGTCSRPPRESRHIDCCLDRTEKNI